MINLPVFPQSRATFNRFETALKKHLFAGTLLLALTAVGCSESASEDPSEAYARLVKAAGERDYGYLYDALDGDMRRGFDSLIALTYRSRATLGPEEKAFWDTVGTRPSRDAFMAVMGRDPLFYTASLQGPYQFIRADTLVVLTIDKGGKEELRYFSPEGGRLRVTSPPITESPALPPGHPDTGGNAPQSDSANAGSGSGSPIRGGETAK